MNEKNEKLLKLQMRGLTNDELKAEYRNAARPDRLYDVVSLKIRVLARIEAQKRRIKL